MLFISAGGRTRVPARVITLNSSAMRAKREKPPGNLSRALVNSIKRLLFISSPVGGF